MITRTDPMIFCVHNLLSVFLGRTTASSCKKATRRLATVAIFAYNRDKSIICDNYLVFKIF